MLGADQRGPRIHLVHPGEGMMGNAEQRLDPGERCLQMPATSEWVLFLGVFFFFCVPRKRRRKLCLHTNVCVCTRVRMLGSI